MLSFADADIARWLGGFFWAFLRILALFSTAPLFGSAAIPARAKVALAVAVAWVVGAAIPAPMTPSLSWPALILAVQQVLVGLAIGFAMQLTLAAMGIAGDFIGVQMGFGFAGLLDVQNRFQVPVMADLFSLVGLVLFVTLNGHLLLLGILVKSFQLVPVAPGSGISLAGWQALARSGVVLFQMGMWLALPVIAVILAGHLAVAVVSRVAPQINIMSVGFSIFMGIGLAATIGLVPFLAPAVEHMIAAGLALAGAALHGS